MLVLTRKQGERIVIGDNIEIVVTEVSGSKVRLGFVAPKEVAIHREEVYRRVARSVGNESPKIDNQLPHQLV